MFVRSPNLRRLDIMMYAMVVRRLKPGEPDSLGHWPAGMTKIWTARSEDDPDVIATWSLFELDEAGYEALRDDAECHAAAPSARRISAAAGVDENEASPAGRGRPPPGLLSFVQRDNANTREARARNPRQSIRSGPVGGWRFFPGGSRTIPAPACWTSHVLSAWMRPSGWRLAAGSSCSAGDRCCWLSADQSGAPAGSAVHP